MTGGRNKYWIPAFAGMTNQRAVGPSSHEASPDFTPSAVPRDWIVEQVSRRTVEQVNRRTGEGGKSVAWTAALWWVLPCLEN